MSWPAPAVELRGRSHCIHGHEFTEENTFRPDDGWRRCRECRRAYIREYMRGYRRKARG